MLIYQPTKCAFAVTVKLFTEVLVPLGPFSGAHPGTCDFKKPKQVAWRFSLCTKSSFILNAISGPLLFTPLWIILDNPVVFGEPVFFGPLSWPVSSITTSFPRHHLLDNFLLTPISLYLLPIQWSLSYWLGSFSFKCPTPQPGFPMRLLGVGSILPGSALSSKRNFSTVKVAG